MGFNFAGSNLSFTKDQGVPPRRGCTTAPYVQFPWLFPSFVCFLLVILQSLMNLLRSILLHHLLFQRLLLLLMLLFLNALILDCLNKHVIHTSCRWSSRGWRSQLVTFVYILSQCLHWFMSLTCFGYQKIATTFVDPKALQPFLNSRSIALDKNPEVCPIGIGEVFKIS